MTADQNHSDTPEQESFDHGSMDLFPLYTGTAGGTPNTYPTVVNTTGLVMGYYDGNTVTGLWNYAPHYAMNDNSFNTQFGPSTPCAINVVSEQTNGIDASTCLGAMDGLKSPSVDIHASLDLEVVSDQVQSKIPFTPHAFPVAGLRSCHISTVASFRYLI